MMRRAFAVSVLLIMALAPAAGAAGPAAVAERVAGDVMSPFCPGLTLSACPSQEASELRARIETWARKGLGEGQIMRRLEEEYGPEVRAAPRAQGSGLLAWALPAAFLLGGAGVLVMTVRRWGRTGAPRGPRLDAAGRARVDEELARLRAHPESRP